ncbi:MAG TPA: hypothetical protein VEU47_10690 [Candidatus Cybelea sp.]|nr:hypothetical protein [Candidatus Cybelea sp.]
MPLHPSDHNQPTYCFAVTARVDPGLMPRILDQFARRNLVPSQWHAAVGGRFGEELSIDVQLQGVERREAERLASLFREMVGVSWVALSEKALAKGQAAI